MESCREKQVKTLVNKLLNQLCIDSNEIKISATSSLDSWISDHYRVEVNGYSKTKEQKRLALFIRMASTHLANRELLNVVPLYKREIYFYTKVLPEFIAIQVENNINVLFQPFPKYYLHSLDYMEEAIALENLKEEGFARIDPKKVDYPTMLLIIKKIGQLHALSFAIKKDKPRVYNELKSNLKDNFFSAPTVSKVTIKIVSNLCNQTLSKCEPHEAPIKNAIENFSKNLSSFSSNILLSKEFEEHYVITHGNIRLRNFFFKFSIGPGSQAPEECCLFDMQLARVASPAFDLLYLMCKTTDNNFRQQHYTSLIEEYHKSFSSFLIELGGDPDKSFPYNVLQNHLRKFAPYGLFTAIWACARRHIIADKASKHNELSEESLIKECTEISDEKYFTLVKELVLDMLGHGYEFSY